jgi:hypothetical protein
MRQRNNYGLVGTTRTNANQRPSGPRRPVTARGRMVLKSSRRQPGPR